MSPVSLGDIVYEESLLYSWVMYPNFYGAFMMFSTSENGPWHFCACARAGLENLMQLNRLHPLTENTDPLRMASIDSFNVPDYAAAIALKYPSNPLDYFMFQEKLCHRCTLQQPTKKYCHEMYGGTFDQLYGWYIAQARLRHGLNSIGSEYLPEICDQETVELADRMQVIAQTLYGEPFQELDDDEVRNLKKQLSSSKRKLTNKFVNIARKEFGYRNVGEGWVSETTVLNIVRSIFPDKEVIHHYRADWLDRLEIDIFVPDLSLAIEYQGQQHFVAVDAWGGDEGLKRTQERDKKKEGLCRDNNVTLAYVNFTDPLTKDFIYSLFVKFGAIKFA